MIYVLMYQHVTCSILQAEGEDQRQQTSVCIISFYYISVSNRASLVRLIRGQARRHRYSTTNNNKGHGTVAYTTLKSHHHTAAQRAQGLEPT